MATYRVELGWAPKRGPSYSRRYRYVGNKQRAYKIAKRIIVRQDSRLRKFRVEVTAQNGTILWAWVKYNGKIMRTI